jgi:hypothetical protein
MALQLNINSLNQEAEFTTPDNGIDRQSQNTVKFLQADTVSHPRKMKTTVVP